MIKSLENISQREAQDSNFDAQFNQKLEGKTENGLFRYIHIKPKNSLGDALIFHPGWLADGDACKTILRDAYNLNQEIFFPELVSHNPPKIINDDAFDEYTLRNAQVLHQISKDNKLTELNLAGHSEGTSVALTAAQLLLKDGVKVKNIILINPTGFGLDRKRGLEAKTELVRRGIKMAWQEFQRKNEGVKPPKTRLAIKQLARHPIHVMKEGLAIANTNMAALTEKVISEGVDVSVIQSEDDPFVDIKDLNTEFQLASQAIRNIEITKVRKETEGMSDFERRTKIEKRKEELENQEIQRTITTAIGNPGHLFIGHHPSTYMQIVVPLIRRQAV